MIMQLLRIIIENLTENLDYLYLVADAPKSIQLELPALSSYDSFILSRQSTELVPWKAMLDETRQYRAYIPEPGVEVWRNGAVIIPLSIIADVDTVARGIIDGSINLDTFLANEYARTEALWAAQLIILEANPETTMLDLNRHRAAMGDYQGVEMAFREAVAIRVSQIRAGGL